MRGSTAPADASRHVPAGRGAPRRRLALSRRGIRQREPAASGAPGGDRRARQVRHGVPRRRADQQRGRPSVADRAPRAADGADRVRCRDQPDRARRHRLDHLRRAVPSGARLRLARPHQPRPGRLERGDHVLRLDRREFRRAASAPMPTATPSPRNSSTWCTGSGTAGGRRLSQGQVDRRYRGPVEAARARSQGQLLLGQGPAQHLAPAAGPSDHRAVGLVRARPAACRPHRGNGLHRPQSLASAQAFYAS